MKLWPYIAILVIAALVAIGNASRDATKVAKEAAERVTSEKQNDNTSQRAQQAVKRALKVLE